MAAPSDRPKLGGVRVRRLGDFPSLAKGKADKTSVSFVLGEHLGADISGVLSSGDDQHRSLHHHGKAFTERCFSHTRKPSFLEIPTHETARSFFNCCS